VNRSKTSMRKHTSALSVISCYTFTPCIHSHDEVEEHILIVFETLFKVLLVTVEAGL
jgi:uncharacterized CHY-type Zn-finger protein